MKRTLLVLVLAGCAASCDLGKPKPKLEEVQDIFTKIDLATRGALDGLHRIQFDNLLLDARYSLYKAEAQAKSDHDKSVIEEYYESWRQYRRASNVWREVEQLHACNEAAVITPTHQGHCDFIDRMARDAIEVTRLNPDEHKLNMQTVDLICTLALEIAWSADARRSGMTEPIVLLHNDRVNREYIPREALKRLDEDVLRSRSGPEPAIRQEIRRTFVAAGPDPESFKRSLESFHIDSELRDKIFYLKFPELYKELARKPGGPSVTPDRTTAFIAWASRTLAKMQKQGPTPALPKAPLI